MWIPVIAVSAWSLYNVAANFAKNERKMQWVAPQIPNVGWPKEPGEFNLNGKGPWGKIGTAIGLVGSAAYEIYNQFKNELDFYEEWKNTLDENPNDNHGDIQINNPTNQSTNGTIYTSSPNANTYRSMTTQARQETTANYNSSLPSSGSGSSSLSGTHWVTPSGAVVTWEGQLVTGPSSQ